MTKTQKIILAVVVTAFMGGLIALFPMFTLFAVCFSVASFGAYLVIDELT
jgi:hypothetical protein